jgi:two-component system response regulator YesN
MWKRSKAIYNWINHKSVFRTLLLSYLIILVLPVTAGTLSYIKIQDIMIENVNRSNSTMLEQLRQAVDGQVKEIDQLTLQISSNPKLLLLFNNGATIDISNPADNYKFIEFMKEIALYRSISSMVNNLYVYFTDSRVILSPIMKTDWDTFFQKVYRYESMDSDKWASMLRTYQYKTYIPSLLVNEGSNQVLTFVHSLPYGEEHDVKGGIIVMINEDNIKDMLKKIEAANGGSVYIVNEKNELILGSSNKQSFPRIFELLKNESGVFTHKVNGEETTVSFISSSQNSWKYISIIPSQVFMSKVNALKLWFYVLLGFHMAIGIVASCFLAYKNYRPLRKLANSLLIGKAFVPYKEKNEYDVLKAFIDTTVDEKKQLNEVLTQHEPLIRANFLSRLLKGNFESSSLTTNSFDFFNLRFISNKFAVILIDIDSIRGFANEDSPRQWVLAMFIVSNISSDICNEQHIGFTVEMDKNKLALLVNMNQTRSDTAMHDLKTIAKAILSVLQNRFKLQISIGISQAQDSAENIHIGYSEALEALDYKIVKGHGSVMLYEELNRLEQHYYYPVDVEVQLINYVKAGDYSSVEKIIETLFEVNFYSKLITPELGKCLLFNLLSTLLKIVNSFNIKYTELFGEEFDPIKQLTHYGDVEELQVKINGLFRRLCDYGKSVRVNHNYVLLDEVKSYIDQHYDDCMLSLGIIAEQFHISPQYLSALYKKYEAHNITDYIAKVRMENAKLLFKDRSLTISEVADKIGYGNDDRLIRVFKKYEGVTPGKYRETMEG